MIYLGIKPTNKTALVLAAVQGGCKTSKEVAAKTGFDVYICAGTMSHLCRAGKLRKTGQFIRSESKGRPSRVYVCSNNKEAAE
jgi:hypothetical protein